MITGVLVSVALVVCVLGPLTGCWIADKVRDRRRLRKLLRPATVLVPAGQARLACVLCSRRLPLSALEPVLTPKPHMWCVDGAECKSYRDSQQIAEGATRQ